jgi:hypothetical protein
VLLLEGLVENTDVGHIDYESVKTALAKVKEVAGYVNEKKREAENISEVLKIQDKVTGDFEVTLCFVTCYKFKELGKAS